MDVLPTVVCLDAHPSLIAVNETHRVVSPSNTKKYVLLDSQIQGEVNTQVVDKDVHFCGTQTEYSVVFVKLIHLAHGFYISQ